MKNYFYLLICFGMFLASCSHSSHNIPFQPVGSDTAIKMISKYLTPDSTADTSFREVPKRLDLDAETLKTFTEKNKNGKVVKVRFILAAYLDHREMYLKNTILLRILRDNKEYYYYDLRVPVDPETGIVISMAQEKSPVCPLPPDCGDK